MIVRKCDELCLHKAVITSVCGAKMQWVRLGDGSDCSFPQEVSGDKFESNNRGNDPVTEPNPPVPMPGVQGHVAFIVDSNGR